MEKNASILVVDDDKEIADLVEIYLVNDGYQVLKASDGEQCLETLKQHPEVRMLILDIMMPGIDGLEGVVRLERPVIFRFLFYQLRRKIWIRLLALVRGQMITLRSHFIR